MSKTGPQRYPGASQAYRYQNQFGGDSMESNVIVWHTTEGTSLPSYSGGSEAPNFTAEPDFAAKKLRWFQHFDFDTSSRALVNKAGGVETNTLNVCQIEIVGTCDPTSHKKWTAKHLYAPDLPDWAVRDLAAFAKWAHDEHGVPLTSGVAFRAYPGSYGANGVRMSASQWESFHGHCGHQHVPENDHGDPGAFPMAAILTAATGGPITQEDDMPLTKDDVELLAKADVFPAARDASDYSADSKKSQHYWTLGTHMQVQSEGIRAVQKTVAATNAAIKTLAGLVGAGVDTDAVVAAVEAAIKDAVITVDINSKEA